jgi:hypothetical protein
VIASVKVRLNEPLQLTLLTFFCSTEELNLEVYRIASKFVQTPSLSHQAVESVFNLVLSASQKLFAHLLPLFPLLESLLE